MTVASWFCHLVFRRVMMALVPRSGLAVCLSSKAVRRRYCSSSPNFQTVAFHEIQSSGHKPYTHTAFILHGLLGSGRNWRSFSRILAATLSRSLPSFSSFEWRMVLVDLRNHGNSTMIEGLDPPHDLFNSAKDLVNLLKTQDWAWPDVVIGHSFGGKVALQFAKSCANGDYGHTASVPQQLWILDSVPGIVSPKNDVGEVEKVLSTLQCLPSSIPSQRWVVNHMIGLGFSKSLSEWIGSNLKKSGGQQTWSFDLEGVIQMFTSYRQTCYWSVLEHPPKGVEIGLVVAEKSDRWEAEETQKLQDLSNGARDDALEGSVSYHLLPDSGHWVHIDNPNGLLAILAPGIQVLHSDSFGPIVEDKQMSIAVYGFLRINPRRDDSSPFGCETLNHRVINQASQR